MLFFRIYYIPLVHESQYNTIEKGYEFYWIYWLSVDVSHNKINLLS
jgi:hypothetical protein